MSPVGFFGVPRGEARFRRDRRGGTAVEFALVGLLYFFILIFALEGGIFYLRVTVLDLATEQAARAIMINQLAGNTIGAPAAPTTATDFQNLIETDSYSVLTVANIKVEVRMAAPLTGTAANANIGFASIPPVANPDNVTYQFVPGTCTVTYSTSINANGTTKYNPPTASTCSAAAHTCTTANFGNLPTYGEVSGGTYNAATSTYTGATYSCSGGQDIVVQAQYTDTTLSALVAYLFGPVTTTLAFQVEPATT